MNNWETLVFLGAILTFFVATILPLLKILLKVNTTIQKNTDTIDGLKNTMNEFTITNKHDHDYFYAKINSHETTLAVLKEKHRND